MEIDRRTLPRDTIEYADKRIVTLTARIRNYEGMDPKALIVNHKGEFEPAGKRVRLDRMVLAKWERVKVSGFPLS